MQRWWKYFVPSIGWLDVVHVLECLQGRIDCRTFVKIA